MASPGKAAAPWAVKLVHDGKEQGVPAEKIRQKLVLEGLEPDLIDGVVEAGSLSAKLHTIEPSSPCTSPQRRQLSARKFHDMLSVGLPPAVVRQKMAMDGCQPEEINNFFASAGGVATAEAEEEMDEEAKLAEPQAA
ncbi:expressed unknown protein [Ectocarpus siliculosus]|uniref:Uncharacterized protein n=1 Tax=Ectocarpus siliculosus TaxID=2880 RepID=D8LEX1_ECTSI|nr:expressed unknown protein [Ectocarpus siliculosus]|eukprot:CBN79791.1 expressed unknown protein [Ectocarpus siliculosus]